MIFILCFVAQFLSDFTFQILNVLYDNRLLLMKCFYSSRLHRGIINIVSGALRTLFCDCSFKRFS